MKGQNGIIIAAMITAVVACADTPDTGFGGCYFGCGAIAGTNYVQCVSQQDVQSYPIWDPESSKSLPLDAKTAVKLARQRLASTIPGLSNAVVCSVLITPVEKTGRWVYYVTFSKGSGKGKIESPFRMGIVVGLNGLVPDLHGERNGPISDRDKEPRR